MGIVLGTIRNGAKFKGRDQKPEPMEEWNRVELRGQFFRSDQKCSKMAYLEVQAQREKQKTNKTNVYGPVLCQGTWVVATESIS